MILADLISNLNVQTFLVLIVVFLFVVNITRAIKQQNLPPGPLGVPILGVFPLLGKKSYLTIQQWWEKYGDVYSMKMGSRLVVVINGKEAMKECLVKQGDIFTGRPWNYFKKVTKNSGIVFTDGEVWREHRRFTLSCMRDFGMGKVCLEDKIIEESRVLMTEIAHENGKSFDLRRHLPKAVCNIICSITYGSRFEYSDEVFVANIEALDQSVRNQTLLGMINFMPFLEFLPKILPTDKMLARNVQMRDQFANEQLAEHMVTYDPDNPRDYIDAYFTRMNEKQKKMEETTFEERHLQRSIQDLFIAGTETVNTTLKWTFLFMMIYPEIQEKVFEEIEKVIGTSRNPTMKDKANMPYTEAVLMECQRRGNIALFSVPRCALEDTELMGYSIPKGTWIFINRWGMHDSAKYWKNPKRFDPDRFLDADGKVIYPEAFVPFGIGPRNCLGETLAKMELFLFFTSMLQVFKFELPSESCHPSLEPKAGINMCPQPYMICATQR